MVGMRQRSGLRRCRLCKGCYRGCFVSGWYDIRPRHGSLSAHERLALTGGARGAMRSSWHAAGVARSLFPRDASDARAARAARRVVSARCISVLATSRWHQPFYATAHAASSSQTEVLCSSSAAAYIQQPAPPPGSADHTSRSPLCSRVQQQQQPWRTAARTPRHSLALSVLLRPSSLAVSGVGPARGGEQAGSKSSS